MNTYTPEQLKEILHLHGKWLRDEPAGKRANLYSANLYGADLTRANLTRANLCGANLTDANLSSANLAYANLSSANLYGADLCGANLSYANLSCADLRGANLTDIHSIWGTIGNMAEIKSIQVDTWPVTYTSTHMQIGCQLHKLSDWWAFDDEQIGCMDSKALAFWRTWKPMLQTIIAASPATPTERAE